MQSRKRREIEFGCYDWEEKVIDTTAERTYGI